MKKVTNERKKLRMNEKKVTNERKLRMCGDSRIWCEYYLVIRDVLSYVLATSDSFQTKSASVFVFG